ncbi:MAG: branched chain amino acid aminotransferase, partial [Pseudomonas capeferrum]
MSNESINWDKQGYDNNKTDKRYLSVWPNGEWDKGTLTEDNELHISEGS